MKKRVLFSAINEKMCIYNLYVILLHFCNNIDVYIVKRQNKTKNEVLNTIASDINLFFKAPYQNVSQDRYAN